MNRSENMRRIRARDTSPELLLRKGLHRAGLRYRLNVKTPGGRADVCIVSSHFAIFIDGCFWHGCPEHYVRPRSRNEFWDSKLEENVLRDARQTAALLAAGWTCVRLWEHEVREAPEDCTSRTLGALHSSTAIVNDWRVLRVEALGVDDVELRHLVNLRTTEARVEKSKRQTRKLGRVTREEG